jgi:D-sedoheptulose 7-phosphate isomerase
VSSPAPGGDDLELPVAILAGGLATRMGALTADTPKALLDVAGEPFVFHQLRLLRAGGFRRVVLCVGHLGERVQAAVGDGRRFGLEVEWLFDGPTLLGTGGALRRALPRLGARFAVVYGDSYLRCDYRAIARAFLASGKLALMTVYRNDGAFDASNVELEGARTESGQAARIVVYDKQRRTPAMRHIDYGLGLFDARAFAAVPDDLPTDLATLYQELLARGELAGFEVPERFFEIGSVAGLEELRTLLAAPPTSTPSAPRGDRMSFTSQFLDEVQQVARALDVESIERAATILAKIRADGGRLFILGVGGSAGNASHAVNDFRKLCGFEAYAPTDNVSELTARTNDEGWKTVFAAWLEGSKLRKEDGLLIFSVGGGDAEKNVSPNLVEALKLARERGSKVIGIVGRDGGYTKRCADACVLIPTVNKEHITPLTEGFQGVVWHLLVTHPALKANATKWESVAAAAKP